ncbi:MAG: MBL fold metallo-hydrolase [Acidimicrobiales bacterium]
MTARAIQIAPGIFRVPTLPFSALNSFVVVESDGSVTLIDTGFRSSPRRIWSALQEMGKGPADVRRVLLTHAHYDHAGGALEVMTRTGTGVEAHEHDARYLRAGRPPASDSANLVGRLLTKLSFGRFPRFEVAATLKDGQVLEVGGGLRVVHTPGHTPGHVSFLHERSGTLITGDAIFNVVGMTSAPPFFAHDLALTRETATRLGDLDYDTAAFTHGREISHDAREKVRAYLRRKGWRTW